MEEKKSKFESRKFLVWMTTTILMVICLIVACLVENEYIAKTAEIFAENYGFISMIYLGANAASQFANKFIKDEELK